MFVPLRGESPFSISLNRCRRPKGRRRFGKINCCLHDDGNGGGLWPPSAPKGRRKASPWGEAGTKIGYSEPIFVTDEGIMLQYLNLFFYFRLFPLIRPSVRTGAPSPEGEGMGVTALNNNLSYQRTGGIWLLVFQ